MIIYVHWYIPGIWQQKEYPNRIQQPSFQIAHKEVGKFPRCLKILASTFHAFLQAACEADFGGFWPSPWNTGHSASSSWHDFSSSELPALISSWYQSIKIGCLMLKSVKKGNASSVLQMQSIAVFQEERTPTSLLARVQVQPVWSKGTQQMIVKSLNKVGDLFLTKNQKEWIWLSLSILAYASVFGHGSADHLPTHILGTLFASRVFEGCLQIKDSAICPPTHVQSPSTWLQLHSVQRNVVTAHQSVDSIHPSLWDMHKGSREQPWKYGGAHDSRPALGLWIEISEWSPPMKSLPFCLCRLLASLQHVSYKSTSPVQMQTSQGHGMQTSTVTVSMRKERPPLGTACAWFTPISVRKYPCRNYLSLYDWRKCVFRFRQ